MREKYYFCFRFTCLSLQNNVEEDLVALATFQIEIFKNRRSVGHTHNINCDPDAEGIIFMNSQVVRFTLDYKPHQLVKNTGEVRLIEVIPGGERLIGSYQFILDNYIQASKELHRSCMEMRVEIGENFILDYVVYLESSLQALEKIVKQHQNAKKMHILENEESDQIDFQQFQMQDEPLQQEVQTIEYDLQSPLIIRQKFWSPTRKRKKNQTGSELVLQEVNQLQPSKINPPHSDRDHKSGGLMKMKRFQSNISDNTSNTLIKRLFVKKERKISDLMEQQVQKFAQIQDHNKSIQQLYDVICSQSKITVSPICSDNEDNDDYRVSPIITQEPSKLEEKKMWWEKVGSKNWIMLALIFAMIFALFFSDSSSKRKNSNNRKPKLPRKSRMSRYNRS